METEEAAQQLHQLEHNMEHLESQKKSFQMQLSDIESALTEIEGKDYSYKIIGNIMVKRSAEHTRKELEEKKSTLGIRISSIEKQEKKFKEKVKELQDTILNNTKK